jgi:hypothetical protein
MPRHSPPWTFAVPLTDWCRRIGFAGSRNPSGHQQVLFQVLDLYPYVAQPCPQCGSVDPCDDDAL